jgi:hypothetical protein
MLRVCWRGWRGCQKVLVRLLISVGLVGTLSGCPNAPSTPDLPPVSTTDAAPAGSSDATARQANTGAVSSQPDGTRASAEHVITPPPPPDEPSYSGIPRNRQPKPVTLLEEPDEEPPYEPKLFFSASQLATCLLKQGDTVADCVLQTKTAELVNLKSKLHPSLNLLVFWNQQETTAKEQRERLEEDLEVPFRANRIHVIAVHVGDAGGPIPTEWTDSNETVDMLLDPDGSCFAKLATEKLPRTYLLDEKGQILWFDIEYSRDSVRELLNAIRWYDQKKAP